MAEGGLRAVGSSGMIWGDRHAHRKSPCRNVAGLNRIRLGLGQLSSPMGMVKKSREACRARRSSTQSGRSALSAWAPGTLQA